MSNDPVYAAAFDVYYQRGWAPIKLHACTKHPPPDGFTGRSGADPSYADMMAWAEGEPDGNIAIRVPPDVIGIDVDAYDGKTGAATLLEAENRWGSLPYSPRSTSRRDSISGIRLYRIPADVQLVDRIEFPERGIGDIEIIQHHHRYAVCAPSVHPTGEVYAWLDAGNWPLEEPAAYTDIPDLPQAWVAALTKPAVTTAELGGHYDVRQALTEGEPSKRVKAKLGQALVACGGSSRHDHTRDNVLALLRYGAQGDPGVMAALLTLQKLFVTAVAPDRAGGHQEANEEFRAFVNSPRVAQLLAQPDAPQPDPPPPDGDARPAVWTFIDGATFILDAPDTIPALWGKGDEVLWAEGESVMIAGPLGVGKTTLSQLVMRARLGLTDHVLSYPVEPTSGTVLYLAMDRPKQVARAARRIFTEEERDILANRVKIWPGPPPSDIARNPELLLRLADAADAETVFLDSIKDAAIGLSEDEVGAGYNRARQYLLRDGRQLCEQHHTVKRGQSGAPTTVNDIYGSAWITNGTGSIILLTGDPGDPIVRMRHIRCPAVEVGPYQLIHDQQTGSINIHHSTDLLELVRLRGADGLSARAAAANMFGTDEPTDSQIEKARRKLAKLETDGQLVSDPGQRGRGVKPSLWFLADQTGAP